MRTVTRRTRSARALVTWAVLLIASAGCVVPPVPTDPPNNVSTIVVPAGNGFGGGTIYYPTGATSRRGAFAVVPGFTASQSSIQWYGPLLAAEGFVVITIDTNSVFDQPDSRATQLLAALDYLSNSSDVRHLVDPNRLAVAGWSMGGGGSLEAAVRRPTLKAAIPLAGWHTTKTFNTSVPTLIVACQNDAIAPNGQHSDAFYNGLPSSTPKAYLEIAGGDHYCVTSSNSTIAKQVVAWARRWVNGDTSASGSLCPPPPVGGPISASKANCPY